MPTTINVGVNEQEKDMLKNSRNAFIRSGKIEKHALSDAMRR